MAVLRRQLLLVAAVLAAGAAGMCPPWLTNTTTISEFTSLHQCDVNATSANATSANATTAGAPPDLSVVCQGCQTPCGLALGKIPSKEYDACAANSSDLVVKAAALAYGVGVKLCETLCSVGVSSCPSFLHNFTALAEWQEKHMCTEDASIGSGSVCDACNSPCGRAIRSVSPAQYMQCAADSPPASPGQVGLAFAALAGNCTSTCGSAASAGGSWAVLALVAAASVMGLAL